MEEGEEASLLPLLLAAARLGTDSLSLRPLLLLLNRSPIRARDKGALERDYTWDNSVGAKPQKQNTSLELQGCSGIEAGDLGRHAEMKARCYHS